MSMLSSIDKSIRFRGLVPLDNRNADSIYNGLSKILQKYNGTGFNVLDMNCDRELKTLVDLIKDKLNVKVNYTSRDKHVSKAEQNNRTIRERI